MHLKEFISRQRIIILCAGLLLFVLALIAGIAVHYDHIWGALFTDLAASAVTVVFTSLVIDYLNEREKHQRTQDIAGLAEDEIAATCLRMEWRIARLFGMERVSGKNSIKNHEEAREYFINIRDKVYDYLDENDVLDESIKLNTKMLPKYLHRIDVARNELEQTLILYEYAIGYSLRERILNLRNELQVADNVLNFMDVNDDVNDDNATLVRVFSKSIQEAVTKVLDHPSKSSPEQSIRSKERSLTA